MPIPYHQLPITSAAHYNRIYSIQASYGEQMVSRYRGEGVARGGAELYRRNSGAPLPVRGRTAAEPTFWEFVQAVIRDGLL